MRELNLLQSAPASTKSVQIGSRTYHHRLIAREFDERFFIGGGEYGYRDYKYDGRWKAVAKTLQEVYRLSQDSAVLDVGCACGFLLYDLQEQIPGIKVAGIDISEWALNNAMRGYGKFAARQDEEQTQKTLEEAAKRKVLPHMILQSRETPSRLPWPDKTFDLVLNINTLHNLPVELVKHSINEMNRVSRNKRNIFVQVDAYRTHEEEIAISAWNLTALTVLSVDDWLKLFKEAGYEGDYFWSILKLDGGNVRK